MKITLSYHVTGNEKDAKKSKRAVSLSMETYCRVSVMLKKNSPIIPKIYLNGKKI